MSEWAQLLWDRIIVHADDFGRLRGEPEWVKAKCKPLSPRPPSDFELALSEMETSGLIKRYVVAGSHYIQIVKFDQHQDGLHKRTRSEFPDPPGSREMDRPEPSEVPGNSGKSPSRNEGEVEGKRREEEGEGFEEPLQQPAPDATPTERALLHELKAISGYPFDYEKDLDYIRNLLVDFADLDLMGEVKKWSTYKRDKPLGKNSNPRLQLRNWLTKAREFAMERRAKDGRNRGSREPPPGESRYDDLVVRDPELPMP
ncbi:MAG: hypothetical protein ACM3ZU_08135 [Bacteroidota bacterium]